MYKNRRNIKIYNDFVYKLGNFFIINMHIFTDTQYVCRINFVFSKKLTILSSLNFLSLKLKSRNVVDILNKLVFGS
jgi:hypothetical protein